MTATSILETALYVTDLEAAETFYREVMRLEVIHRAAGRHVFFRCTTSVLLLFNAEATRTPLSPQARLPVPAHGATGAGHICFAATPRELDDWKTRLESADVVIEADFHWPNGGRSLYFRDPSGNSIEIAEPRIWGF